MKPTIAPLLLALALLAAATPSRATVRWSERSDGVADARGIRALEVDNSRGDVLVTPSPDGRIHVTALKTCRGRDRAEAKRFAGQIGVSAAPEGDRYVIRVTYPRRVDIRVNFWDLLFGGEDHKDVGPSHQLDLQVQAPASLDLRVTSASGDLTARGLAGRQALSTSSGDCGVDAAGGVVDVRTASGDVRLRGARRAVVRSSSGDIEAEPGGALDASTSSGDIRVTGATDSLVLGTASGDITVDAAPRGLVATTSSGTIEARAVAGAADVHSTSGGVTLDLVAPLRGATVTNSSGDVELGLGAGVEATLDLETTSGDINCELPVKLVKQERRSMIAKYGRGGATVKARTVSGDLHVTSGGR